MPHESLEGETRPAVVTVSAASTASDPRTGKLAAPPIGNASSLLSASSWGLLVAALLTILDAALALRPWLATALTAASLLALPIWTLASLRLLRMEAQELQVSKVRVEQGTPFMVLIVIGFLLLCLLLSKAWIVWLAWNTATPEHFAVPYRVFGTSAYMLAALGLLGRPRRLARFLAQAAEHHARLMVLSFGLASLFGAFLLTLPGALRNVSDASFVDALFTAVSALCVTGLTVSSIPHTYTFFGQAVILALVQLGGLGIMVLYSFFGVLAGRRLRVQHTAVMAEMLDIHSLSSLRRSLLGIIGVTLFFEAIGAAALYWFFLDYPEVALGLDAGGPIAGAGDRLWAAVFHSISAFCNAGFSLFPAGMMPFVSSFPICFTLAVLIVLGGLGFPVHFELARGLWSKMRRRRVPRLSLHTRTVLVTSAALIALGALGTALLEGHRVLFEHGFGTRLLASFFHSVGARSGGYNSFDMAALSAPTLLLTAVLMFVGGSPGSTAGGIKTTTFAVLFATFRGELRNEARIHLGGRSLSPATTRRALGVAFVSTSFLFVLLFSILLFEDHAPHQLGFEVLSALATVGLSTGITASLSSAGKLILIVAMLVGRIGPLTLALLLEKQTRRAHLELPEERVGIG